LTELTELRNFQINGIFLTGKHEDMKYMKRAGEILNRINKIYRIGGGE
jgi:hypothetical protein